MDRYIKEFFIQYLRQQKGASPHTIKSYRDSFRLLISYIRSKRRLKRPLEVKDLDSKTILGFLSYLQDVRHGRGNSTLTRNLRLAAIGSFFQYISLHHPSLESLAKRIAAIPIKKTYLKNADFLTRQEMEAVLAQPCVATSDGIRDLAIITLLYNTGARAQEIADLTIASFDFPNRNVRIIGKGRKERTIPLWPATVELLLLYQQKHRRRPYPPASASFFINQRSQAFTRLGIRLLVKKYIKMASGKCRSLAGRRLSTHHIRHSTATHLTQSGVDPNVLKDWMGHALIQSGDRYRHADLSQKRRILEQFGPPDYVQSCLGGPKGPSTENLLQWLGDL
ncbi:MAG: tyrosine-type recombinase/integrase [Elusimicrobia bacterium]|nr:tyrosine-type recombinase/integrase [Elusimicrobiota bacterium]